MTKKNSLLRFTLCAAVALGMASTALAQTPNGTIRGAVLDPSGALIPRAQVTISSANGYIRTMKTNATGAFELPHLAPGNYSVSVYATGFTPTLEGGIQVAGDKITSKNIRLGISVNQVVEVLSTDKDAGILRLDASNGPNLSL